MDDGAALILTVANYFTPAKRIFRPTALLQPRSALRSIDDLLAQPDLSHPPAQPSSSPEDPVVKKAIDLLQAML